MSNRLTELAHKHGSKISALVMGLILAGVTASTGILWQLNGEVSTLSANQLSSAKAVDQRTGSVNEQFRKIWTTDRDQYDRLETLSGGIGDNKTDIRVLQNRMDAFERRKSPGG